MDVHFLHSYKEFLNQKKEKEKEKACMFLSSGFDLAALENVVFTTGKGILEVCRGSNYGI